MTEPRNILVAVYGSLRQNMGNHRLLENADFMGTMKTDPVFTLHSLGGFPGLKTGGTTAVTVEIYKVNETEARRIDQLEGYTPGEPAYFYDKMYIDTPFGTAGIYTYVKELSQESIVESGDWTEFRTSKSKKVSEY